MNTKIAEYQGLIVKANNKIADIKDAINQIRQYFDGALSRYAVMKASDDGSNNEDAGNEDEDADAMKMQVKMQVMKMQMKMRIMKMQVMKMKMQMKMQVMKMKMQVMKMIR